MARLERERLALDQMVPAAGRVPPQALEAEMSVLGAMLREKEAIGRARNFAAYVPDDIRSPQLELLILLPQAS